MLKLDYLTGSEISKAIQFLISDYGNLLPFKRPNSLIISIDRTDQLFFSKLNSNNSDVKDIVTKLEKRNNTKDGLEKEINKILIALFVNLLLTERKYSTSMQFSHTFDFKPKEKIKAFIRKFFIELKDNKVVFGNKSASYKRYEELSRIVPEFIDYLDNLINSESIQLDPTGNGLILKIDENSEQYFKELMQFYLKVKGVTPFLKFRWRSLSTGEQSFLSLVSRFHHLKHHEIGSDNLKKDLIILIDEGDAGYHPEWQRQFFKNTMEFISKLFADHNIQLIFTANAPFLTSDLPKYCVNFIEKISSDEVVIHEKQNSRSETFASNIHTLFSDSFYMDGALIGSFAKYKIDTIIKYLNSKDYIDQKLHYKKTIDLIGEPIVRRKLQTMWNEKFGLDQELAFLLSQVEEVRNKIKNRNQN